MTKAAPSPRRSALDRRTDETVTPAAKQRAPAVGNQAMQRLLGTGTRAVQPKLAIGAAHDPLEAEADRLAEQVMRSGATGAAGVSSQVTPQVQRRGASAAGSAAPAAPASVSELIAKPGRAIDPATRADMGQRFGADFSQVRVHIGDDAAASARSISAHAYTAGRHIVFGAGQYRPGTPQGNRLLAHELTHTLQQGRAAPTLVQRDFAIGPTVANPAAAALTPREVRDAISFDQVAFTDAAEIEVVRDVLGISRQPAVVDEEFVNAVARYQAGFGLTVDGMLGRGTAEQLAREITAEADSLADPATGTPLRRTARRLVLRSMVSRRRGTLTHQGFVGDDQNPEGAVTVRMGDVEGGTTNAISLEYTGENANGVDWLQFINMQMFATVPATGIVFNAGNVGTTGGQVAWSNAATTNWFVDAVPGAVSPLYNVSGFLNTRAAARRIAMFDEPGGASGLPVAQAFAAGAAAGATTVTMRMRFDSYAIRNNRARYHVSWTATTRYNITAGTSGNIIYSQGGAGAVAGLRGVHRTALLAEYAGNPIR